MPAIARADGMPHPALIFLHLESADGYNARRSECSSFSARHRLFFDTLSACSPRLHTVSGEMNFPIARLVCDQINLAVIIPCHI